MDSSPGTRFVLVPGFWLGAWAWDRVAAPLRAAGADVRALTLPGLEAGAGDRGAVTLEDHVRAVVDALEEDAARPAVLVGHSGAGPVVHAATDRAPHRVRRVVYVDSWPLPAGSAVMPDLDPSLAEVRLPGWKTLEDDGNSLAGLTPADLAEFRTRAVAQPAGPAREPVSLSGGAGLHDVPVTVVASSLGADDVRSLVAGGSPYFAELARLDATVVDLPTGHWPMWSRPDDLAAELLRAAGEPGARATSPAQP